MEIKTKFDIGQEVWLAIKGYRVRKSKITMIVIHKDGYVYVVDKRDVDFVFENEIFATKQEAEQKLKEIEKWKHQNLKQNGKEAKKHTQTPEHQQ